MKTFLSLLAMLCTGAMLVAGADAPATSTFRAFDIGWADASEAVAVVKELLGADGKVFLDPSSRRLMVLAPSNRLEQVEALVQEMDVPPRNVRIEVVFRGQGRNTEREASVSSGMVVIDNGRTHSRLRLKPRLTDSSSTITSSTAQQIVVSSGRQASIFVGENVPYIEWIMDYGIHYGVIERRVAWQQVGASLVVEPFVIGDGPTLRVRLTPELSGLVDGNPYRTRFTTVATEVIVSDGVPFSLGGLNENRDFFSRFLVGVSKSGARQNLGIELTAHIMSPTGLVGDGGVGGK